MIKIDNFLKYILILSVVVMFSCTANNNHITPLEVTKELKVKKSVAVPDGCFTEAFIYDSLLVLVGYCDTSSFQIYNKNNLKLIRKFGKKGKSPHEFHTPLPFSTNSTSDLNNPVLHFNDINLVRKQQIDFKKISLGYKEFECITSESLDKNLSFSNDLGFLEEDKIVGRQIDESKGLFYIYDKKLKEKKWIDYVPNAKISTKYRLMAYYGYLCTNSQNIMYAGRFFDEILFYDSNRQLLKEHYFSKIEEPLLSKKFSGVSQESMLYAMKAYGTPDFCYVVRIARTGNDFQKNKNTPSKILVFDWDGNLADVYQHESFPSCFCVDETSKTMYCITKSNDMDEINIEKIEL